MNEPLTAIECHDDIVIPTGHVICEAEMTLTGVSTPNRDGSKAVAREARF